MILGHWLTTQHSLITSLLLVPISQAAGPLAQQRWAPLQFWALYSLPLVPAAPPAAALLRRPSQQQLDGPGEPAHLLLRWVLSTALCFADHSMSCLTADGPSLCGSGLSMGPPRCSRRAARPPRWLLKAAVTAGVVFGLLLDVPPFARTCLYVLGIYSMLGGFNSDSTSLACLLATFGVIGLRLILLGSTPQLLSPRPPR